MRGAAMSQYMPPTKYKREIEIIPFQGKEITLENLVPIFTAEEEEKTRRELEQRLYEIFRKYEAVRKGQEDSE